MIPSLEESEQDGGDGAHAAAEDKTSGAALKDVDGTLYRLLRQIRHP